jgi:hypothetical protein
MHIQELFSNDITRPINPAVVVSEMADFYVNQEIEEYIFTADIIRNMHKFFHALTHQQRGKTGVWISGYYGSGKSHFIKYLFYCLNPSFHQKAFKRFEDAVRNQEDPLAEVTPAQVFDIRKQLENMKVQEIIFNIDKKSGDKNKKDVITKILFNEFNRFRGYNDNNIALATLLEKHLDQKGHSENFQQRVQEKFGDKWVGNQHRFVQTYLTEVVQIAKEFDPLLDVEALTHAIKNPPDYRIADLIEEFSRFLADKPDNYRLVFLLDEMSQYIGSSTSLLLNLQTIIEEIGTQCDNKIWIACTAQQDLTNLIAKSEDKVEDFGKILGRFDTILSLQSQDAAFITKKRLLDKKPEGLAALTAYYGKNKGGIENQFVLVHDLYQNYHDKDEFLTTYPFVPYQFRLISDVFASFSRAGYVGEGVKDTERSILGITHYTAKLAKEQEVGYFVPFDLFFNEQLTKDLTHFANNIIQRAYQIEQVRKEPFAKRVVNTLFMISNIGESLQVNFPATVENISLLLLDRIDQGKVDMQTKVQDVLTHLVDKKIIQEVDNIYRFLKEDEIEVANQIDNTTVNLPDRLDRLYNDILSKNIRSAYKYNFGNNSFKAAVSVDDKVVNQKGDFAIRFSVFDNTPLENLAHQSPKDQLLMCIHDWFAKEDGLKKDFLQYAKTAKFIEDNRTRSAGQRRQTIDTFGKNNEVLLENLKKRFEAKLLETAFISNQRILHPEELNGQNATARFEDAVQRHLEEVYKKNGLAAGYANRNDELVAKAKNKQGNFDKELTAAEEEVESKVTLLGEGCTVDDVVKKFEDPPFGWKDLSTLDVLLQLARKERRAFKWRSEDIDHVAFVEKALNSREREAITIIPLRGFSPEQTRQFVDVINHKVFAENLLLPGADFKTVVADLKEKLKPKLKTANELKETYPGFPFHASLREWHQSLATLYEERDMSRLLQHCTQQADKLRQQRDQFTELKAFLEERSEKYREMKAFEADNRSNFGSLDETNQVRAERLKEYLTSDDQPWERFPEMLKIYQGLDSAIRERVKSLQDETLSAYEAAYDELETQQKTMGLDANLLPDRDTLISKIKKTKTITELQLYKAKLHQFRAEGLKAFHDEKARMDEAAGKTARRSEVYAFQEDPDFNTVQIENEEQLEAFLKSLKEKLLKKLQDDKIIIIK